MCGAKIILNLTFEAYKLQSRFALRSLKNQPVQGVSPSVGIDQDPLFLGCKSTMRLTTTTVPIQRVFVRRVYAMR